MNHESANDIDIATDTIICAKATADEFFYTYINREDDDLIVNEESEVVSEGTVLSGAELLTTGLESETYLGCCNRLGQEGSDEQHSKNTSSCTTFESASDEKQLLSQESCSTERVSNNNYVRQALCPLTNFHEDRMKSESIITNDVSSLQNYSTSVNDENLKFLTGKVDTNDDNTDSFAGCNDFEWKENEGKSGKKSDLITLYGNAVSEKAPQSSLSSISDISVQSILRQRIANSSQFISMSLFKRNLNISKPEPDSHTISRDQNDDDTKSVLSDLMHDGKSVRLSSTSMHPMSFNKCDEPQRQHLNESGLVLVKRLIEFLSECPPAPDEGLSQQAVDDTLTCTRKMFKLDTDLKPHRGLTLPASAVGWLSSEIDRIHGCRKVSFNCFAEDIADCYQVPEQQLQCLESMLHRVTSLRLTMDTWPPPLTPKFPAISETGNISSKLLTKFTEDLSTSKNSIEDECSTSDRSQEKEPVMTPFQRYFHVLQHNPYVNMSLFPYASKIVIIGIPPHWISNLHTLKHLDMFQMEKGCILDINKLFFPSDFSRTDANEAACIEKNDCHTKGSSSSTHDLVDIHVPITFDDSPLFFYSKLSKLRLSNCAIGEHAGLQGKKVSKISESEILLSSRRRVPTLSRFPRLVSLNLSHNELFRTKTALAGLSSLHLLSSINLSHNRLSRMNDVFMYVGNIKELILSRNEISTAQGLDRLFSLERLLLDDNKIENLADISGIAKLPFLMNLHLKGNPFEVVDPSTCRIKVLNLFREIRCKSMPKNASYRDMQQLLPILDNNIATREELVALKELTFRPAVMPSETSYHDIDGEATMRVDDTSEISINIDERRLPHRILKMSPSRIIHFRSGLKLFEDKVILLRKAFYDGDERKSSRFSLDPKYNNDHDLRFRIEEVIYSIRPSDEFNDSSQRSINENTRKFRAISSFSEGKYDEVLDEKHEMSYTCTLPPSFLAEADEETWNPPKPIDVPYCPKFLAHSTTNHDLNGSDAKYEMISEDVENENVTTTGSLLSANGDLTANGFTQSNVVNYFKDMYIKKDSSIDINQNELDSEEVIHTKCNTSLFDGIWEQTFCENTANSAIDIGKKYSAIQTLPKSIDYVTEEFNAVYDGPDDYSSVLVSCDLDLYFYSYVFPRGSVDDGSQNKYNQRERMLIPRIQLFKFDRNFHAEKMKSEGMTHPSNLMERYVGVWTESVLACGYYARSRLCPIRMPKRGFHGGIITCAGKDGMVSESRKFIICLSSAALYFIIDDDVTLTQKKSNNEKRLFPSRMPPQSTFGDAMWPHAVIRHSLDCLYGITIGFQFQRLVLRFSVSNDVGSSLEYAYILLTSNKFRTISLLQKLQSNSEGNTVLIENDDKSFLDALGARSDEVVLHYQILHQLWKRGSREAARRAFVVTDSNIYLLDETYHGDGTNSDDNNKRLGDVSLVIIDSAKLKRVIEVRAANEDPRMITLVILAENMLKRSHRWRLLCNDGEGAERLIDDVRKAMGDVSSLT